MSAQMLEGVIRLEELANRGSEIYMNDKSVAKWADDVIPRLGGRRKVKAVLMIEDAQFLEATGFLIANEGDSGYSSYTPGTGPSVYVWDNDGNTADIVEVLEQHECRNAALSLEVIS